MREPKGWHDDAYEEVYALRGDIVKLQAALVAYGRQLDEARDEARRLRDGMARPCEVCGHEGDMFLVCGFCRDRADSSREAAL